MSKSSDKIAQARWWVAENYPYYTSVLFSLEVVETEHEGLPTMGVSKNWVLYYNPNFVMEHEADFLGIVLIHEVHHMLRKHSSRCNNRDHTIWNYAGDIEINNFLKKDCSRFTKVIDRFVNGWGTFSEDGTPHRALTSESVEEDYRKMGKEIELPLGYHAEYYYDVLVQNSPGKSGVKISGSGTSGQGSVSDGNSREWENSDKEHKKGDPGQSRLSDMDKELKLKEAANKMLKHLKNKGEGHGDFIRWLEDVYGTSKVPWPELLRATIRSSIARTQGMSDYSYHKPSRRKIPRVVLPSMISYLPNVTIITDTSGSIGENEISKMMIEIDAIIRKAGMDTVRVISWDAGLGSDNRNVRNVRQLKHKIKGGGGTAMDAAVDYVSENSIGTTLLIVMTDGYTDWNCKQTKFDTIILSTVEDTLKNIPSWSKGIFVDFDEN